MLHELRRREDQAARFLVSISPLTEIARGRQDFSRRERENCNTLGTESLRKDTLSAESIDRRASIKGTRHEARKDRVRRPFEIAPMRVSTPRVARANMRKDLTRGDRFFVNAYIENEKRSLNSKRRILGRRRKGDSENKIKRQLALP